MTAPPAGPTVIVFPSVSTQKHREPTHCSGRKSPSREHAGMWISALAAMFDLTSRAAARALSQGDGQRGRRVTV